MPREYIMPTFTIPKVFIYTTCPDVGPLAGKSIQVAIHRDEGYTAEMCNVDAGDKHKRDFAGKLRKLRKINPAMCDVVLREKKVSFNASDAHSRAPMALTTDQALDMAVAEHSPEEIVAMLKERGINVAELTDTAPAPAEQDAS
jgi:hypothetical protein